MSRVFLILLCSIVAVAEPFNSDAFKPWQGSYRLDNGEVLTLVMAISEDQGASYKWNDWWVRLTPAGENTFQSARDETLTLRDGTVTVRKADGTSFIGKPLGAYAEESVSLDHDGAHLAGTILLPTTPGPHPAVILAHGSGPETRYAYRLHGDWFARNGVAALVYDKRGFGDSTGSSNNDETELLASDMRAWFHALRKRDDIDPARVGLWGFSNGSWVAPRAAAKLEDVAFIIVAGAAGITPMDQELYRCWNVMKAAGAPDELAKKVYRLIYMRFAWQTTGAWDAAWDEEFAALVAELRQRDDLAAIREKTLSLGTMAIPPLSDLESVKKHQRLTWPQGAYDPLPDYQRLTCPVLFIVGEFDSNVPAKEGAGRIAAAMKEVNHTDFTAAIIPRAEHGLTLMPPEVNDPIAARAVRAAPVRQYAPEYFPLMAEWTKARCGLK